MQLGRIIPLSNQNNKEPSYRYNSAPAKLDTAKGVFYEDKILYNQGTFEFYVTLIRLYDKAILYDSLSPLSREQERLLREYFIQAGSVTPSNITSTVAGSTPQPVMYDPTVLTKMIRQLDEFLAGFMGTEDGNYARLDRK